MIRILLFALVASFLATAQARAGVYYAVQTGIQGGQTGINSAATATWSFTVGSPWSFGGGTFTMKSGSNTTLPIMLSVYSGTNFGTLVGNLSLTQSAFCSQLGSNCQNFGDVQFLFSTPLALSTNTIYYVDLTSMTGTSGSLQYFLKGTSSTLSFVDANNNPMPAQNLIVSSSSIPEPATLGFAVMAVFCGAVPWFRRRRRTPAQAVVGGSIQPVSPASFLFSADGVSTLIGTNVGS